MKVEKIWTIGHSIRTIEEFIDAARSAEIGLIADVRSFPSSRRYPQFNRSELRHSLRKAGISYEHFPELGGRRQPRSDSQNTAWRNQSFRGYADHMETDEYRRGVVRLTGFGNQNIALMCAEALWWKCHRSLIADYMKARDVEVIHIVGTNKLEPHRFTSAARVVDGQLSYGPLQK